MRLKDSDRSASYMSPTAFKDKEKASLMDDLKLDFSKITAIPTMSWLFSLLCCKSKYRRMMMKSKSGIEKEMDLRKFIYRQRLQTTAMIGLLSKNQSFFVDRMSQLIIRESSNFEDTSSDNELSDWEDGG